MQSQSLQKVTDLPGKASENNNNQSKTKTFPAVKVLQNRPVQKIEDEPLQGKSAVQKQDIEEEDELPLQGKFITQLQSNEEEELPIQGKFVVQKQELDEEELPMQGRFIVQRAIAEEKTDKLLLPRRFTPHRSAQETPSGTIQRFILPESIAQQTAQSVQRSTPQKQFVRKKENKTGLPENLKEGVENLSGIAMDDVKVDYNFPRAMQLKSIQETANNSPQTKQITQLQTYANSQLKNSPIKDNKNPLQMRSINGKITTEKVGENWQIKPLGISDPPNLTINPSPQVAIGGGVNKTVMLGVDDFMRGHLIKAAWEGKNEMEQMTHWRLENEEQEWTNIEVAAEAEAVSNAKKYKGKNKTLIHNITTKTDEPYIGNRVLGADTNKIPVKWLLNQAKTNAGSEVIVDNIRTELNRMVTSAKMDVAGQEVGSMISNAHENLRIKE